MKKSLQIFLILIAQSYFQYIHTSQKSYVNDISFIYSVDAINSFLASERTKIIDEHDFFMKKMIKFRRWLHEQEDSKKPIQKLTLKDYQKYDEDELQEYVRNRNRYIAPENKKLLVNTDAQGWAYILER